MNVITRSVLIDFLLVFVLSLAILVALLLFVGASLDLPKDVGVAEIVLMLPYLLPEAVRNAMQAAALFAACSVFGRLSAGNEILALSSLGVSPWKVIRPVMVLAVFMSLACVWLYDVGESWGQRGIHQVVVNSAETIASRYLRTKHAYTKGPVTLNVKAVEGRTLIRPMLIMERPDHAEPITIAAEEAELRTPGPKPRAVARDAQRHGLHRRQGFDGLSRGHGANHFARRSGRRPAELASRVLHPGRLAARH